MPPPRRLSYASVAAGTAGGPTSNSNNQGPTTRANALARFADYVADPPGYVNPREVESRPPYSYGQTEEGRVTTQNISARTPMAWQRESTSSYADHYSFVADSHGLHNGNSRGLLRPSYLVGSRYMNELEDAYEVRQLAQRESTVHDPRTPPLSKSSSSVSLPKIAPSHRGMAYEIVEHMPVLEEDAVPPLPSKWADLDRHGGLDTTGDGSDIRFASVLKSADHEASAARTDHPIPHQCGIYYYEVTIVQKGKDGMIAIGFSTAKASLERLPGWEEDSWAYHSDDGKIFPGQSAGKAYGPGFGAGDVVGCGIDFMNGTAWFTKNGVFQGLAFRDIKSSKLYPSIGMKRPGAVLKVNFGNSPFLFDIDGTVAREKASIRHDINTMPVTEEDPQLIMKLVMQFLKHGGYVDAAKAFAKEVSADAEIFGNHQKDKDFHVSEDLDTMRRQKIRNAVLNGQIDDAIAKTGEWYPSVLQKNPRIYFRLRCRKFVEMMRACTELLDRTPTKPSKAPNGHSEDVFGQPMELDEPSTNGEDWDRMDTEEVNNSVNYEKATQAAVFYAQELRTQYKDDHSKETEDTFREIFALFAYQEPSNTPAAALMDQASRVPVAEELNSAILVSLGKSSAAAIELICQQTEVLLREISCPGGPGAFINLENDILMQA